MKNNWLYVLIGLLILSCSSESDSNEPDNNGEGSESGFDRKAILTNWADQIIMPSYEAYVVSTSSLKASSDLFVNSPSQENLQQLRANYMEAYTTWQNVSMFEVGAAETLQLRNFTNIYPANVSEINQNIEEATYNLELPSSFDEQGFPALDYLLYGIGSTEEEVVNFYLNNTEAGTYLSALTLRLDSLAKQVNNAWKDGFRDVYIDNDGSSVNASFNKTVNAFIQYYERNLRSGKVGIPAGALSGTPNSALVEGFYAKTWSKMLLQEAITAVKRFYLGTRFNSSVQGASLSSALSDLDQSALADDISAQFDVINSSITGLGDNFITEVETNNTAMLSLRDDLQVNTILFKNDMVSTLNITISYQDNDGD